MGLTLKNEQPEGKVEKKLEDLSDDYIAGIEPAGTMGGMSSGAYTNNPVKITASVSAPTQSSYKSGFDVMGIIKWIVIAVVVVVGVKFLAGIINPKATDVTGYGDMDTEQLEKALDIELQENSDMNRQITHYSNSTVTVDGDGDIGVVYFDGKQKGIHINNKKYSMYGISIGDGEFKIDDNITFEYDEYYSVLDDMLGGKSTATFYCNTKENECLVIIINDKSARVVAMTYFNDCKLITQNLSGLDE